LTNIKLLNIRRDSSGVITHRRFYNPRSAIVKREGNRGADNMSFSLDITSKIQKNDEVYYIQDIVDLDNLVGMYNFYGNFRDESGFEQDDFYTGNYSIPDAVTGTGAQALTEPNKSFKGYYKVPISVYTEDGIKMNKAYELQDNTNKPIIDMSADFDIFFWFNSQNNGHTLRTLVDIYNDVIDKGLLLQLEDTNNRVKLTVGDGTSNIIYTPNSSLDPDDATNHLVRVTRFGGTFKIYIDNVEQTLTGTASFAGNLNDYNDSVNTVDFFHLFKAYSETSTLYVSDTGFKGHGLQLRFYNISLPDDEASKIYTSKPQQMTMKFGGNVWKIEDGMNKKYNAISFASKLLNTILTTDNITGTPSNSNVSRTGLSYTDGKSYELISDILENIGDNEFVHITKEPTSDPIMYGDGDISASGTFLDFMELIMIFEETKFFSVLPRKVLIIEEYIESNYIVSSSNFRILDYFYDDTNTTNKVEVVGNSMPKKGAYSRTGVTFNNNAWGAWGSVAIDGDSVGLDYFLSFTLDGNDATEWTSSTDPVSGSGFYYQVDDARTSIRLWSNHSTTIHSWSYELIYRFSITYGTGGGALSTTQIRSDTTSIGVNGLYSKKINLPKINDGLNLADFANKYITRHKDINLRVKVITPSLINSMSIGQKVGVYYDTKNISQLGTGNLMKVASIEWKYPETTTTIELGESEFNSFDVEKSESSSNRVLNDSSTRFR
tara:strand:- start:780 stop:2936 length:2157 start_codon:yes stop_codon:yes gene_type:complete